MSEKSKFGRYIGEKIAETIKDFRGVADEAAPVARREADNATRASRRAIDEAPRPVTTTRTPRAAEASAPKAAAPRTPHPDAPTARTASDLERRGLIGGETGGMFGATARETQDAQRAAQAERQAAATQQQTAGYTPVPQQQQMQQALGPQRPPETEVEKSIRLMNERHAAAAKKAAERGETPELVDVKGNPIGSASRVETAPSDPRNLSAGQIYEANRQSENLFRETRDKASSLITRAMESDTNVIVSREEISELKTLLGPRLIASETPTEGLKKEDLLEQLFGDTNNVTNEKGLRVFTGKPITTADFRELIVNPQYARQPIPDVTFHLGDASATLPTIALPHDKIPVLRDALIKDGRWVSSPERTMVRVDENGKIARATDGTGEPIKVAQIDAYLRADSRNQITSADFVEEIIKPQALKQEIPGISKEIAKASSSAKKTYLSSEQVETLRDALIARNQINDSVSNFPKHKTIRDLDLHLRDRNNTISNADFDRLITEPQRKKAPVEIPIPFSKGKTFSINKGIATKGAIAAGIAAAPVVGFVDTNLIGQNDGGIYGVYQKAAGRNGWVGSPENTYYIQGHAERTEAKRTDLEKQVGVTQQEASQVQADRTKVAAEGMQAGQGTIATALAGGHQANSQADCPNLTEIYNNLEQYGNLPKSELSVIKNAYNLVAQGCNPNDPAYKQTLEANLAGVRPETRATALEAAGISP